MLVGMEEMYKLYFFGYRGFKRVISYLTESASSAPDEI
jgi:hypothetical protein